MTTPRSQRGGRFAGWISPVYVIIDSASMSSISVAILLCWSTRPVVGAIRRTLPRCSRKASAIAIHSTAVLPNPVGMTMRVEELNAERSALIW